MAMNPSRIGTGSAYFFRLPPEKETDGNTKSSVKDELDDDLKDEKGILCRQCLHLITTPAERISMHGSHKHVFFNPHGILFEIGCFRAASGCRYTGRATKEWSWFPGYSWRIGVCSGCLTHLGWLFVSEGYNSFNGLIINRIVETG